MSASHTVHYMDELETLRVSTELFLKNLSQEEVLSITGERAVQISQAQYCEIFIRDPNDREFVSTVRLADGKAPDSAPLASRQLAMEAVQKQHPLICPSHPPAADTWQSWLVFPFKVMGNIVGVLCLAHPQENVFSPYTVKLLSIFVDQASIAISNAQLFEDVSRTYAKLARSREEILQTSNTLQTLFDGVSDGLYIIDRDFRIITVNRAEQERLRLSQTEVQAQSFLELGWAAEAPEFVEVIRRTFQSGQTACWIPPASADSPLLKNRQIHLYPIVTPQNTVEQIILFAQDITEQRRLQASLFESANLA
ncbi:MAG: GAF domain-containing protein, partial [Caldilineae bacterium]